MVSLTGGPQADVGAAEPVVSGVLVHVQLGEGGIQVCLAPYMGLETEIPAPCCSGEVGGGE